MMKENLMKYARNTSGIWLPKTSENCCCLYYKMMKENLMKYARKTSGIWVQAPPPLAAVINSYISYQSLPQKTRQLQKWNRENCSVGQHDDVT
jgi:hypothetical protein